MKKQLMDVGFTIAFIAISPFYGVLTEIWLHFLQLLLHLASAATDCILQEMPIQAPTPRASLIRLP